MTLTWTAPEPAEVLDGYLDWARLLHVRRDALAPRDRTDRNWYEPIFVRLRHGDAASRARLQDLVDDPAQPFVMDPFEAARLAARRAEEAPWTELPDEYMLYRRAGTPGDAEGELWVLLDVGARVDLDPDERPEAPGQDATAQALPSSGPIVAIIDDGIAMLNRRFRRGDRTRFHAVWLQSDERARGTEGGARRARIGEVLTAADIDAALAQGPALDEAAWYRRLNGRVLGPGAHRSTEFGSSHGTHVLDLAAGADPEDAGDPARDWPLLAVQLPPEAIEDTSGTRFESYMVQALRWILGQAREIGTDRPVIVNVSLGMSAGPKDGTRFAEYQMAREAEAWTAATGQNVRIVYSFGNNQRSRQVARMVWAADDTREIEEREIVWRAQPSDLTASYMEICLPPGIASGEIEVALTAPGRDHDFAPVPEGARRTLLREGAAIARLYHLPALALDETTVQRARYVLALAPTEGLKPREPAAPPGGWRVALRYRGTAALEVHLQIQRGESLPGYRPRGRQSYFDDPRAYGWDDETRDWSRPHPDGALAREGSHSAIVTARPDCVLSAGAARVSPEAPQAAPARYTAEGAAWSVTGPTLSALAEEGVALQGVIAAATLSEGARQLSGTSAAAGRITRALAMAGGARDMPALEAAGIAILSGDDASRLGSGCVDPGAGARRRRE
ncbi:hypothetical protein OCH239_08765 [Roseivivax halodurans JCM 10272]|uniref:Peptidase S8/S53 domain-containing protein n=1 Tax=Roseivivax halodurans JCM 10272 TaxID=1449350 RepID=X7EJH8_9RHOB|nr:S8 family serine peptidase [Roseivivax halodurans]ETX16264.1 hypothetical protein OCH239_08765 [Roseivivax halodurans JCM 10272]